nr:hypothetical protein [uncultured Albidiferax sp.]
MSTPFHLLESVKRLRLRGHQGGTILQHRAISRLHLPRHRLWLGLALAVLLTLLLVLLRPWVAQAWALEMVWWMQVLELPGHFDARGRGGDGLLALAVPFIDLQLAAPNGWAPVGHGLVALSVWWVAGRMSDAAKPVAYLLRFAVLVHGASVLFFIFWPASFPHSVDQHVGSGLRQAWHLMLLAPWIHFATYYLFPFAFWQRVLLTVLSWLFLGLLTPLQYALHVALVQHGGLVVMPLLHLLFGVMLDIIGFVALYGWAMGWRLQRGAHAQE